MVEPTQLPNFDSVYNVMNFRLSCLRSAFTSFLIMMVIIFGATTIALFYEVKSLRDDINGITAKAKID